MYEDKDTIAARAEMLASMDCLMHYLDDTNDFGQWTQNALRDGLEWHVLDNSKGRPEARAMNYFSAACNMDDFQFQCIVRTFATIVKSQCFEQRFRPHAFVERHERNEA